MGGGGRGPSSPLFFQIGAQELENPNEEMWLRGGQVTDSVGGKAA